MTTGDAIALVVMLIVLVPVLWHEWKWTSKDD